MAPIDLEDADDSLEDCTRHLDPFVSVVNYFHVKGDDKYTRSVECIIFMITNGRIPTIDEMTTDDFGLQSMRYCECHLDNGSYKDLCHRIKRLIMYRCLELIFRVMRIQKICIECFWTSRRKSLPKELHAEFSKFFRTEYFNGESNKTGGSLAILRGIQQYFIEIQNRCVRAADELSRMVIETAAQRPATLKDFRTQELSLERQT